MITSTATTYPLDVRRVSSEQSAMSQPSGPAGRALRRLAAWETLAAWHGVPVGTRYMPCPLCATDLDLHDGTAWDVEHAVSEWNGGQSTSSNICATCTDCNAAKGDDLSLPVYVAGVQDAGSNVIPSRGSDALQMLRTLGVIGGVGGRRSLESPMERAARRAMLARIWQ